MIFNRFITLKKLTMKKIIFLMILVGGASTLFAQDITSYSATSTGDYKAYNAPNNIRMNFQSNYPNAADVSWQPMNEWWVAKYTTNNRLMRVYYGPNGTSYALALPAIQNKISEEVITKAINQYGNNIYDITMMKAANNSTVYMIRSMNNGTISSSWINEDGSVASDVFVHR
jgi:hypothetical protein